MVDNCRKHYSYASWGESLARVYTGEMVKNCCVFGCKNYVGKKERARFFKFLLGDKERYAKWTAAVRREAWQPKKFTRICNKYFIAGRLTRID